MAPIKLFHLSHSHFCGRICVILIVFDVQRGCGVHLAPCCTDGTIPSGIQMNSFKIRKVSTPTLDVNNQHTVLSNPCCLLCIFV